MVIEAHPDRLVAGVAQSQSQTAFGFRDGLLITRLAHHDLMVLTVGLLNHDPLAGRQGPSVLELRQVVATGRGKGHGARFDIAGKGIVIPPYSQLSRHELELLVRTRSAPVSFRDPEVVGRCRPRRTVAPMKPWPGRVVPFALNLHPGEAGPDLAENAPVGTQVSRVLQAEEYIDKVGPGTRNQPAVHDRR